MTLRLRLVGILVSFVALAALLALTSPASSQPKPIPSGTITVSAAASLTDVFPVVAQAFERKYPQIKVRFNFGGSPSLVEQVRAGAPVDVLATASEPVIRKAVSQGLVERPLLFAKNSLIIATPPGNPAKVASINDLVRVSVATCQETVPCGSAAASLFALNKVNVTPVTKELDVRAVLGKVMADQVDAGIVYVTDVRAVGKKVTGVAIPVKDNVTTTYPIAIVSDTRQRAAAKAFVDYVRYSSSAQGILRAWGFARP